MASVPALRLDRLWRVRLIGRTRWLVERGDAEDRAAALQVRRDVYRADLGKDLPIDGDGMDTRAHLCVIRTANGQPVGSLRIAGPEDRPFDLDAYVDLSQVFDESTRLAEMSRFAVLPEYRSMTSGVHMAAFEFAFLLASRERFSHFVLMSFADTRAMWGWLLFEPTGLAFKHHAFENRDTLVLALDLRGVAERYRAARHALAPLLLRAQEAATAPA